VSEPRPWTARTVVAALVLVAGCGTSPARTAPGDGSGDGTPSPDAAAAVAVVTAWVEAVRAGDGETACGHATRAFAEQLVGEAMSFGAPPTRSCARAVRALARLGHAPEPVAEISVASATDDSIVLLLESRDVEDQLATLVDHDGVWLLDGVGFAPEPT
jgi:hypothetical protein